jgi:hypothetical protein
MSNFVGHYVFRFRLLERFAAAMFVLRLVLVQNGQDPHTIHACG